MLELVKAETFYHLNNTPHYSPYKPMREKDVITNGSSMNPFFSFYETYHRAYQVNDNDAGGAVKQIGAMKLLELVRDGKASGPQLSAAVFETANHFFMLSRELFWETVRLAEFCDAPSRQRCIWLVSAIEDAKRWVVKTGFKNYSLVKVSATGRVLRVDANHLPRDSEQLPIWRDRARKYWSGQQSSDPVPEVLFEGTIEVQEVIGALT